MVVRVGGLRLAGPLFLMVLSLGKGSIPRDIAKKIAKRGADHDVGLIFGKYLISYILKHDQKFLYDVLKVFPHPFVFLVTSDPLENDAMDLFQQQLNIWHGADPSKATMIKFLEEVLSMPEIENAMAAIWDSMVPDLYRMPTYQVSTAEFIDSIRSFYKNQVGGPEGIYRIGM